MPESQDFSQMQPQANKTSDIITGFDRDRMRLKAI